METGAREREKEMREKKGGKRERCLDGTRSG